MQEQMIAFSLFDEIADEVETQQYDHSIDMVDLEDLDFQDVPKNNRRA